MRKKLLLVFIASMLMLPTAAFATDTEPTSDRSDQPVELTRDTDVERDRKTDRRCLEQDPITDRCCAAFGDEYPERCRKYHCRDIDVATDRCCKYFADQYPERCRDHCRNTDQLTDRCCKYFADQYPERCRDHCEDTDQLTDRCCLYLAGDHPERCRDDEVDEPDYRKLFWRIVHAGDWQMLIRLLKFLEII